DDVTVGERLHVALAGREQRLRMRVLRNHRRGSRARVQSEHEPARLRVHLGHGAVVEDAYRSPGQRRGVVLEGGARAGGEPDVGVAPADRAEHLAAGGAQLVQRPGVARGYQRRAVFLLFDGVDVQVVGGPADAGRAGPAVAVEI